MDFLPLVGFNIIGIDSASGTVKVINADNGGSGTSPENPALFDYLHQLGADDTFSAGETSGPRQLQFRDERTEQFTFDALVTAFVPTGGASATTDAGTSGTISGGGTEQGASLLRFTVNPLTGAVTGELLSGVL